MDAVWCYMSFLFVLVRWSQGNVQCFCSTAECQRSYDLVCYTESLCYVQYTPSGRDVDPDEPKVVRGCIDGKTPLLCENQRPGVYGGTWPVLYCCSSDLCNKDAIPTLPSWAADLEESRRNESASKSSPHGRPTSHKYAPVEKTIQGQINNDHISDIQEDTENSQIPKKSRGRRFSINPLYVGVPVAGACVLLAIIIFAIYILRRQHRMYEEHYQRTRQIKRRPPPSHQDVCHYLTIASNTGPHVVRCNNGCVYSDSDRSSNGSESRLLSQV